jgi:hypothetical protein
MILEISPDSSAVVRGAAAAILFLHIGGGLVGILSGTTAMVLRKGGQAHRLAGNVFFVSMLIMAFIGAVVSPFLPTADWVNVIAGCFTFYLVLTAWMTARRKGGTGYFELGAFVFAVATALGGIAVGLLGMNAPGSVGTSPFGAALAFGIIAALAAIGDLRMIRRGGIAGRQRIGRHLWRMCLALLIATGSLFGGQPQVFPESWRGTGILYLPVLAVLLAMIFWMLRVRFANKWRTAR